MRSTSACRVGQIVVALSCGVRAETACSEAYGMITARYRCQIFACRDRTDTSYNPFADRSSHHAVPIEITLARACAGASAKQDQHQSFGRTPTRVLTRTKYMHYQIVQCHETALRANPSVPRPSSISISISMSLQSGEPGCACRSVCSPVASHTVTG